MTNVAAPYRRPVWAALAESAELTVILLENQARFRRGGTNRGREWAEYESTPYDLTELPTARVTRGESSYYTALRLGFLRRYRPDAVLLGGWESPAYWQALIWCKLRRVRTVGFYESTLSTQHHKRGPIAAIRRVFFKLVDRVVVPGVAARDAVLAMGVQNSRVDVGFNAVDVEKIAKLAQSARTTSAEMGHRFLYLGQLIERKNVRSLIDAFALVGDAVDSLTIAGLGEQESELQAHVDHLRLSGRVRFAGHIPYSEIPTLLAAHDTLVLASLQEVWGLVVNEALAAGLHVVVAKTAGVAPSVDGMTGVFLSGTNVESVGDAMARSRNSWIGPIAKPEIVSRTPGEFAAVFGRSLAIRGMEGGRPS